MGKLAILYAAFQLREDVRDIVRAAKSQGQQIADARALDRKLRDVWKNRPLKLPSLDYDRPIAPNDSRLWLEQVFGKDALANALATKNASNINFDGFEGCGLNTLTESIGTAKQAVVNELNGPVHEEGLPSVKNWDAIAQFPFAHRLWMAIGWSDNSAANMCAFDIGMQYITALLEQSGLATSRASDLWVKDPYANPPNGHHSRFTALKEVLPLCPTLFKQTGSPRGLGALMIALQQRTLVSQEASDDMQKLLRPVEFADDSQPVTTRILTALSMAADGTRPNDAWMKGGKVEKGGINVCDWAYVKTGDREVGLIVLDSFQTATVSAEKRLESFVQDAWTFL
jgi:hypothetical protein